LTHDEIGKAVLEVIAAIAPETDVRALRPDQPLRPQVDLDSMDWLNVIAALCGRLGIDIADADIGQLSTIHAIVACAASRLAESGGIARPTTPGTDALLTSTRHIVAGRDVVLRPIRADDLPLEADFVRHLSSESRYERFMVTVGELSPKKLRYLTDVDQDRHVALVATTGRDGQEAIVGVVRYIVDPSGSSCEFAAAIDDAWHGSGLAGLLMHALIAVARARGLRTMEGFVLATNAPMLHFARQLGFRVQRHPDDRDTMHVVRDL
jgi:acetyltransferase